jgi:hypothetical protein
MLSSIAWTVRPRAQFPQKTDCKAVKTLSGWLRSENEGAEGYQREGRNFLICTVPVLAKKRHHIFERVALS